MLFRSNIASLTDEIDEFVRKSYFGGRTEIFKPCFLQTKDNEILRTFDVNSLYPAVMRMCEFPGSVKTRTKTLNLDAIAFYDVDVEVPDMYVPPLGMVHGEFQRLIFPTGQFRGTFSTAELKYAVSLGVKILKVHEGIVFRSQGFI